MAISKPETKTTQPNESESLSISVIVPVYNSGEQLRRCLAAIAASDYPNFECIVVDDSSTEDLSGVLGNFDVRVLRLEGGPAGPALARNRGCEVATGDAVFFVDADVLVHPDTLSKVAETFETRPEIDAVFGSYDDEPEEGDFSSQFKNLQHHFVHQHANQEASTFWSGCGAVRRDVFLEVGGFDEQLFSRPSIEDIELGVRLRASDHRIALNKDMQATHLKRWTLRRMIEADVFARAIPWTRLIMEKGDLPRDLNLQVSQRLSAFLLLLVLGQVALSAFFHNIVALPLVLLLFLSVAGYWNWNNGVAPLGRISGRAEIFSYSIVVAVVVTTFYFGQARLLPPLGLMIFGFLAGRFVRSSNHWWKTLSFTALVLGLVGTVIVNVAAFAIWLWLPLLVTVSAIILLNFRFYLFFVRKRGVTFAIAALPFHFLYFLYSIIVFVAVAAQVRIRGQSHRHV